MGKTAVADKKKPAKTGAAAKKPRMVRINALVPEHVREKMRRAASARGCSQTDFVTTAIEEAAEKVVRESLVLKVGLEDQRRLAAALMDDGPVVITEGLARLRRAARDHRKYVRSI